MGWQRVTVEADVAEEEALADRLTETFGPGIEILDSRASKLLPEAAALAPGRILLRAYVQDGAPVRVDLDGFPSARYVGVSPVADDWQTRWKDFFHVTRVSERFVVRPPWESLEEPASPGTLEIVIEPGMAFGTGTHETTRACIRALDGLVDLEDRVLDVGCGSGILSVAAAMLGAHEVLAIDIDPPSVDATLANARVNGVAHKIVSETTALDRIDGTWDLVVANILSSVLLVLSESLVAHVRPGGTLVLSGILGDEADDVSASFQSLGVTEVRRLEEAHWACLVMHRPAETV